MNYKNAKNILPHELLQQIQQYIQGDVLYIPKCESEKIAWGEKNGTRQAIYLRNLSIYELYLSGHSMNDIVALYHLSESSIRKIVAKVKKEFEGDEQNTLATHVDHMD